MSDREGRTGHKRREVGMGMKLVVRLVVIYRDAPESTNPTYNFIWYFRALFKKVDFERNTWGTGFINDWMIEDIRLMARMTSKHANRLCYLHLSICYLIFVCRTGEVCQILAFQPNLFQIYWERRPSQRKQGSASKMCQNHQTYGTFQRKELLHG